jgi:DNA polymerase-3 subunit delta
MILARRPEIDSFLNAPPAEVHAALIYGRDMAIAEERADAVAGRLTARPEDPFDVALLTEEDLDDDRLEEELAANSMMGGRRLVRLRLASENPGADRRVTKSLEAHLAGAFNPDAFLLIQAPALSKDSVLRRAAEKAKGCVAIPCYDDEPGDLARLARQALAADKISLTAEALELFISRLPRERGVARREIERLAMFVGPGRMGAAEASEIEPFLGVEPEASLAQVAADAFGGRLGQAYAGLRRASQEGEGGPAAVRALSAHLSRLRHVITLHQSGLTLQEAAKAARVFWRDEKEVLRQARTWTLTDLDRLQPEILSTDRACKQTGSADVLIVQHLALTIAGRARRLGL